MDEVIGLADDVIIAACEEASQGEVCAAVNLNSPGQVVIAGNKAAVDRAGEILKAKGAKRVLPLAVSVPSHCALMKEAADKLAQTLENIAFKAPEVSVINNVDVSKETDVAKIKDALVRQLYSPVRWVETVHSMAANDKVDALVEVGPGKVLTGLIKRIAKDVNSLAYNDQSSLDAALEVTK
jgi:[acyl-carrier-protein] S-malonyltransferase